MDLALANKRYVLTPCYIVLVLLSAHGDHVLRLSCFILLTLLYGKKVESATLKWI